MNFPLNLTVNVDSHNGNFTRTITLNKPLTIILGPNGSGKTHILRAMRRSLEAHSGGKIVRFLSAGRMGPLEQFRSNYDGHRGDNPRYDEATYGSKNDGKRRHLIETISGDFQTLAERADILIKIQERLRKLFKRELLVEWDGGNLRVLFSRLSQGGAPYSSGREASGLMHLVGILAALYDDEVGALLIDEPEVSLHPQLQAFLLKEVIRVSGIPSEKDNKKIVVIATHSTEMLQIKSPEDLLSLVFCYDLDKEPVQIPASSGELKNKKIQGLVSRLGQEHKLSLFSKRPLLVEGPSDVLIASSLAEKCGLHLEAAGSQLLPIIGKGEIPVVTKLLRLLGKAPVVLADADGIADGMDLVSCFISESKSAKEKASELGFESVGHMANAIYDTFCKLVQDRWSEISAIAETHPYWINRVGEGSEQAKRRAAFSALFNTEDQALSDLSADNGWLLIKRRFAALLAVLEEFGLFILRKGTIESYYQKADKYISVGKPGAALEEVEHIDGMTLDDVKAAYSDVLRCLAHASSSETISEAKALRDLLLSVVSPAHARFSMGEKDVDYNSLARSLLGEKARILELSAVGDALVVSMKSKILDVSGFPISIRKTDNVLVCINTALALNA